MKNYKLITRLARKIDTFISTLILLKEIAFLIFGSNL